MYTVLIFLNVKNSMEMDYKKYGKCVLGEVVIGF